MLLGAALVFSFLLVQPALSAARPDNGDRSLVVEFFYFDSRARKVSVVGSFNQWSPDAHVMEKHGDRWSLEVPLPPGRYEYAFLIDDRVWKADPSSLVKENSGFGASNSILIVE
jgi:1,4-alpha-glucan branching enzyme